MDDNSSKNFKADILVIDDTIQSLRLITNILTDAGYDIRPILKPSRGLSVAFQKPPDLVLLDIMMPEMDGFEVCRRLKADERTSAVPVIFISALNETFDKLRAFEAGGIDYITKPFQKEEIVVRIATHLKLQKLQKDLYTKNVQLKQEITERIRSDKELKKSEENYRSIFNSANDAIFIHDMASGIILNVNQKMLKMYGFDSKDQVIGSFVSELSAGKPPFTDEEAKEWISKVIKGDPQIFEWLAKDKHGRLFWVDVNLKRIIIGGMDRILAIVRNIDARKKTEEAVREREYWLRESQRVAQIGTYTLDIATGKWTSTAILDNIYGIDSAYEKSINGWIEIIHPEYRKLLTDYLQEILDCRTKFDKVFRILRFSDKAERWVHGVGELFFDECGNPEKMVGTIRDITEQKFAEDALRASKSELQALFTTIMDVVIVLDRKGRYLKIAPTSPELLFKPAPQLIGKTLHEIFPEQKANLFLEKIHQSLDKSKTVTIEYQMDIRGEVAWFNGRISPLAKDSVVFVARDVTDRKSIEKNLQAAKEEAEAASLTKSSFLHDMNRDLETPLNIILDVAQSMVADSTLSDKHKENLSNINKSGQHLLEIINNGLATKNKKSK